MNDQTLVPKWLNPAILIDEETQKRLNTPLATSGLDDQDRAFLQDVTQKIESDTIKLYQPSSLLNQAVYEKLDESSQGKADENAMTLLADIRTIYDLWKANMADTYQMQNLVRHVRLTKERLESLGGDIFII